MGLKLICNNSNNDDIISKNNNEDVTIDDNSNGNNTLIENRSLVTNDQAEKVASNNISNAKSNFDLFITLRESGYSLKQIYDNKLLELSYGTLKNYNCKYKKIEIV